MPKVVLFCTSVATTLKIKTDITKIKHILDAKRVEYEEVDLTEQPGRREGMLADSGGVKALPQLHIDGKLVGHAEEVQELEDWGELGYLLRGEPIPGLPQPEPEDAFQEDQEVFFAAPVAALPLSSPQGEEAAAAQADAAAPAGEAAAAAAPAEDGAAEAEEAADAANAPEQSPILEEGPPAEPSAEPLPAAEAAPAPPGSPAQPAAGEGVSPGASEASPEPEPAEAVLEVATPASAAPLTVASGVGAGASLPAAEPQGGATSAAAPAAEGSEEGPDPATPERGAAATVCSSPLAPDFVTLAAAGGAVPAPAVGAPEELSRATPEAVRRWLAPSPTDF